MPTLWKRWYRQMTQTNVRCISASHRLPSKLLVRVVLVVLVHQHEDERVGVINGLPVRFLVSVVQCSSASFR